ncbi:aldo/keto reductase [Methylobacterium sp. J-072]|uniref:aldo/keto reductase n=1 Tax=Methylobacterium sp. J-072 TaxID=2836651 RepID=UPI001FB95822|nr:aldo/keto reductase [Methylobacterium sp. J-072]MCJ2094113.1 aldo/keto reductase [Methylobacterium sp. J-072]
MQQRRLGSELSVSALGLGCMGMSFAYGGQPEAEAIATLRRAVDLGITFFDTAEMYGPFENETLVGKALAPVRDQVVIATKFGFKIAETGQGRDRIIGVDSRPEHVRAVCDASLQRLGVEVIDLFYQHRVDPAVPIEDTVGAMADLVRAGKVRTLGLSEAGAATIRRAHAVHPIAAVQSEYSLWSREPEAVVLPTCVELGIGFVPYSPLGRGLLTGAIRDRGSLAEDDFRRTLPRFEAENLAANQRLIDALATLAADKGVTPAQLALAWVLHRGDGIVPIPGARKIRHLEENAAAAEIVLSADDLAAIDAAMPPEAISGRRYTDAALALVEG